MHLLEHGVAGLGGVGHVVELELHLLLGEEFCGAVGSDGGFGDLLGRKSVDGYIMF